MTDSLTMALAQINPTVGDIDGNANRIVEARAVAAKQGADLVVTDGDLLEITTRVIHLYIDGVPVDLSNRQTRFYERYRARLGRLQGR